MKFFWSGKGNQGIEILTCYDVTLDINKELIIAFKEVIKGYWEKYGLDSEKVIDKDKITGWDATIRFRFLIRENDEDRFVNTMEAFFKKYLPNEKYKITGRRRKKKEMKKMIFAVIAVVFMATQSMAGEVRTMGYYDVIREREDITITGYAGLPHNFGFWGFVDFYTPRGDEDLVNEADITSFYGEANVHYKIMLNDNSKRQLRLMMEINDGSVPTAVLRPGLQYFHIANWGTFGAKLLPYKIDLVEQDPTPDPMGQVGIAWRINFLGNKAFFEGFADLHWFWENQKDFYPFLTEPQVGYNLTKNWSLIVEYRYANLAPHQDDQGLGFGFEYRFK